MTVGEYIGELNELIEKLKELDEECPIEFIQDESGFMTYYLGTIEQYTNELN